MNEKYSSLFTPWKIGNCEIKNRIVQVSMGGTSLFGWLEPCHFDKEAAYHILNRAQNNVGLVLPGMQCVRDTMGIPGRHWLYQNKRMFRELAEWMPEFHKTGAKLFIQLSAGMGRSMAINQLMVDMLQKKALGAVAKGVLDVDYVCASSSETPNRWYPEVKSRALTKEEIHEMIEAFGKTAKMLMDAGVDGVEIHAVHEGYLLDQFAIANMNYRTDEYGGSFENRYRFAVEIVQEIKKLCGKDFPVSLRYSVVSKTKGFGQGAVPGEEFVEFGRDMAESEKAIKYLEDAGYDMFNCDNGTYDAWYWAHPPVYMPPNCNIADVEHIKNFTTKPVVCAGKMEPEFAAKEIAEGRIDAMGVGRQNLVDPEWINKLLEDREEEIKPCINCHNACFNFNCSKGTPNMQPMDDALHLARCALTPPTMQHNKYKIVPTKSPKKVAIVGGGIGGMECALVLKKRGHTPVIYEKSGKLGGMYNYASAMSFKEADKKLLEWYDRELKKAGIEVHLNRSSPCPASTRRSRLKSCSPAIRTTATRSCSSAAASPRAKRLTSLCCRASTRSLSNTPMTSSPRPAPALPTPPSCAKCSCSRRSPSISSTPSARSATATSWSSRAAAEMPSRSSVTASSTVWASVPRRSRLRASMSARSAPPRSGATCATLSGAHGMSA